MDIWNEKIMKNIDVYERIKKISYIPVKKHDKELRSDRFVNLRITTQVEEEE